MIRRKDPPICQTCFEEIPADDPICQAWDGSLMCARCFANACTVRTVDRIIADCAITAHEKDGLAWMPEPPRDITGPHDCRRGGSLGLDFNSTAPHAEWARARHRVRREA
jgi:hypothetical protein